MDKVKENYMKFTPATREIGKFIYHTSKSGCRLDRFRLLKTYTRFLANWILPGNYKEISTKIVLDVSLRAHYLENLLFSIY